MQASPARPSFFGWVCASVRSVIHPVSIVVISTARARALRVPFGDHPAGDPCPIRSDDVASHLSDGCPRCGAGGDRRSAFRGRGRWPSRRGPRCGLSRRVRPGSVAMSAARVTLLGSPRPGPEQLSTHRGRPSFQGLLWPSDLPLQVDRAAVPCHMCHKSPRVSLPVIVRDASTLDLASGLPFTSSFRPRPGGMSSTTG